MIDELHGAELAAGCSSDYIKDSSIESKFQQMIQKGKKLQSNYSLENRKNDITIFLAAAVFPHDIERREYVDEFQLSGYLIDASYGDKSAEMQLCRWMTDSIQLTWQESLMVAAQCLRNKFDYRKMDDYY